MDMTLQDIIILLALHSPLISNLIFYWRRCRKDLQRRKEAKG